jgi:hypothetical protein
MGGGNQDPLGEPARTMATTTETWATDGADWATERIIETRSAKRRGASPVKARHTVTLAQLMVRFRVQELRNQKKSASSAMTAATTSAIFTQLFG